MTDLQLKGAQVSDTITVPPGPGTILFRGSDWDNSVTIDGEGLVTFGAKYDRTTLATEIAVLLVRDFPNRGVFEGRIPRPDMTIGFDITPDGHVSFVNWLPTGEAAEFVHALAGAYTRAAGGLGR